MISARNFCREPGYPVTIFLTYSFDPLFFERVSLEDLNVGGTRRILILADAGEVTESLKRSAGQIFHLGRKYTLAEAKTSNLFHPKLIVRLSPQGGRVWIGSGNLNYTGWGGNHELATAWSIGPGQEDSGRWLSDVLSSVRMVTSSESFRSQIEFIRSSFPWLVSAQGDAAQSTVLLGMPNRPLAPQLARRWEGRRFTMLKVYTGSTDVDGAFLLWAHNTFGVKKATVCLTPSFASFDAKQLARLPCDVRFVQRDPKRRVHAKLYWFSGPDGDAAVMGSANCSAAAWLANHDNGNIELITVYDAPERAAFAPILLDFDGEESLPKDVLTAPVKPLEPPNDQDQGPSYRITSIRLRASGRVIEAVVEPVPDDVDEVLLIVDTKKEEYRVQMKRSGVRWVGRLSDEASLGFEPLFATIEVSAETGVIVTPPRWIDNERAIENAARDREVDPNQNVFSGRGFGGANEQRIMEAIQAISTSLLDFEAPDGPDLSGDLGHVFKPEAAAEPEDGPAGPVDPSKLTYNLNEESGNKGSQGSSHGGFHGMSLKGVMKLMFATEDEADIDLSQERWSAYEPEKYSPEDDLNSDSQNDNNGPPKPPVARSDAEALTALLGQIDQWLAELAKPSFAQRCPAWKLTQALVFPIMLGVKGHEEGWLPDDALASIACRVVHIMDGNLYGPSEPKGLFHYVKARYVADNKREEFSKAVGDGALYTVLLAALAKPEAHSVASLVQQADAISRVLNSPELTAFADTDQRASLIQTVIIRDASFAINERAALLAKGIKRLSATLKEWDRLNPGRTTRSSIRRAGTVLWSPQGWRVTPRKPAETYSIGVNLDSVAANDANVQTAIEDLWQAMRVSPLPLKAAPPERPS